MKSVLTLMCNCCKKSIGYIDTDILSEFGSAISKTCIYGKTSTIYCPECWAKEIKMSEEITDKMCKNCAYRVNNYGYSQCYAQKNAPTIENLNGTCERWSWNKKGVMKNE